MMRPLLTAPSWSTCAATAVALVLAHGSVGGVSLMGSTALAQGGVQSSPAGLGLPYDVQRGVFTFAAGLDASLPAVVQVTTLGQSRGPVSDDNPKPSQGGSGVIIDAAKGIIITNHHVIENGQKYTVDLLDGRLFDAVLVGADKATDIAVLKIEATGLSQVEVVDSDTLRTGDLAFAVGYPMGLDQTLTMGVISGLNRSGVGDNIEDYIQTDAAVNQGNSGGPLMDSRGRLIGINTAILSGGMGGGNDGIAFAVPTRIMNFVVGQLLEHGEVSRGQIGVALGSLSAERARELKMNIVRGAVVYDLMPGSSAEAAGLRVGDVITEIGGRRVTGESSVLATIGIAEAGSQLPVTYLRQGQEATATLSVQPQAKEGAVQVGREAMIGLGLTARNQAGSNPQVMVVEAGTPAERAGLMAGDHILSVQGRGVSDIVALGRSLSGAARDVRLEIERDGRRQVLTLTP
jgi:serine protease DegQ